MLKSDNARMLYAWARDLGKTHAFMDFHVHPYEVLNGDIGYKPDPQTEGLFSKGLFKYHSPVLESEMDILPSTSHLVSDNQRALLMAGRLTYSHTGSKVFADQLDLVGLSGALLLPVSRAAGQAEEMLEASRKMFQMGDRLFPGCPFPIGVQPEELATFFRSARKKYGIRAIKFHPNLAGIDPLTQKGEDLLNASLTVAGVLNLPLVVHSGRTPGLEPAELREYGTISHLAMVNWNISTAPVILAHAGCYGLTDEESVEALSILNKLLEKHSNLMADTSNLEPSILQLVLEKISPDRLIFGSDALYIPIWKAWVRFLQTLQHVSMHSDDDLIRIASLNPAACLSLSLTH